MFNLMEFLFITGAKLEDGTDAKKIIHEYDAENIRKGYLSYSTASGCSRQIDNSEYRESIHRDREVILCQT